MIQRTTKLRWRRRVRDGKRQVESLGTQAEEQLERHLFRRVSKLSLVRRFMIGWILLIVLLTGITIYQTTSLGQYYKVQQPVPGGTFREGIVGAFTDANPLYATGAVDGAVAELVFSGLLKYDNDNQLVGDLAESWAANEKGNVYTVILRGDLKWHDGVPVTADDVVFTYQTIQNPDARSPLMSSWQGIKVEAKGDRTIVFSLPNVLASFPHALTNGIVPKHLLGEIQPSQLRSARFNTDHPIGSGPFMWDQLEIVGDTPETRIGTIAFTPYAAYHDGKPKLERFVIKAFLEEETMIQAFERKELTAMSGRGVDVVPDSLLENQGMEEYNIPLTGQVGVFFRMSHEFLSDVKVRQALVRGANQQNILDGLGYPVVSSRSPLLDGQIGYDKNILQLPYGPAESNKLLDAAGWVMGADGYRAKDGKLLQFNLFAQNSSEYTFVTQQLQKDWQAIGVKVEVMLQAAEDLQSTVTYHNYDVLLYGIAIGPDPDVFAYWHSSQADVRAPNRVNFSEYASAVADASLEAGRTRTDPQLRAVKYKPFLQVWQTDAPAVMLYQPRFLYLAQQEVAGFDPKTINNATQRYANIQEWMIRTANVPQ